MKRLLLAGALLWACFHASHLAAQPPEHVRGVESSRLARTIFDGGAVVEVELDARYEAFEVTRVLFGDIEIGARLRYYECHRIRMTETAPATLQRLLALPVVTITPQADETLALGPDQIERFEPRTPTSRFVIVMGDVFDLPKWHFAVQTVGEDFFLIQDDRVYTPEWAQGVSFWAPYPVAPSAAAFPGRLQEEIAYKRGYLAAAAITAPARRIEALRPYVIPDPPDAGPDGRAWTYRRAAIDAIAASGPDGTALLRRSADHPDFSDSFGQIIELQGEHSDRAAVSWLRRLVQRSLAETASFPWPRPVCDDPDDGLRRRLTALCAGTRSLVAIGDPASAAEARAGVAWLMAQGGEWWGGWPFTFGEILPDGTRHGRELRLEPLPSTDPLAELARTQIALPFWAWGREIDGEEIERLRALMSEWADGYGVEAVPLLLSCWARFEDGHLEHHARTLLAEIVGRDLGDDGLAYWIWYRDAAQRA